MNGELSEQNLRQLQRWFVMRIILYAKLYCMIFQIAAILTRLLLSHLLEKYYAKVYLVQQRSNGEGQGETLRPMQQQKQYLSSEVGNCSSQRIGTTHLVSHRKRSHGAQLLLSLNMTWHISRCKAFTEDCHVLIGQIKTDLSSLIVLRFWPIKFQYIPIVSLLGRAEVSNFSRDKKKHQPSYEILKYVKNIHVLTNS